MRITDFLQEKPLPTAQRDELLCDIAGVTAAHVEGVAAVGDPLVGAAPGYVPRPGYGVDVHQWNGDIWLGLLAVIEPGYSCKQVKEEIEARVQAALWNLLDQQAISIHIELFNPDGSPAEKPEPEKLIPFS